MDLHISFKGYGWFVCIGFWLGGLIVVVFLFYLINNNRPVWIVPIPALIDVVVTDVITIGRVELLLLLLFILAAIIVADVKVAVIHYGIVVLYARIRVLAIVIVWVVVAIITAATTI